LLAPDALDLQVEHVVAHEPPWFSNDLERAELVLLVKQLNQILLHHEADFGQQGFFLHEAAAQVDELQRMVLGSGELENLRGLLKCVLVAACRLASGAHMKTDSHGHYQLCFLVQTFDCFEDLGKVSGNGTHAKFDVKFALGLAFVNCDPQDHPHFVLLTLVGVLDFAGIIQGLHCLSYFL